MATDWFTALTGLVETSAADLRRHLELSGSTLRSRNGRSVGIGTLKTPSLGELRARAQSRREALAGPLRVTQVLADVAALHRDPANRGALFQVASQFNLLEMTSPSVTPEDGVTRYAHDRTQGPACAIAAGGATIYRNYFVEVGGEVGQTRDRQIDCLSDVGAALGNDSGRLWTMKNGYALCSESGLATIAQTLDGMAERERGAIQDALRIGVHSDVEVTAPHPTGILVSQVFCSALPVAYNGIPSDRWAPFAQLILDAAYEATICAAVENAAHQSPGNHDARGQRIVFLTLLGGGAFGNDPSWILSALRRALDLVRGVALDVRIVSHRRRNPAIDDLCEK